MGQLIRRVSSDGSKQLFPSSELSYFMNLTGRETSTGANSQHSDVMLVLRVSGRQIYCSREMQH